MDNFTIKDLERFSGIKAHTIRIWEQRYDFLKPQRTPTNIRYYSGDELKTLLNIVLLNKYGYKISQINELDSKEINKKIDELSGEDSKKEKLVNTLTQEMIDLDMEAFEHLLSGLIADMGIEAMITDIVLPFLEKVGLLWESGVIHPAYEHLVTNIIRQKLIVATETLVPDKKSNKTFLLFLPEGEHQELGLLFINYLLKKKGGQIIYLGASVPVKDVAHVIALKKPDFTFIHLTSENPQLKLDKLVTSLLQFKNTHTVISGKATRLFHKKTPAQITLIHSLSDLMETITSKIP
jgi:MerR family transcriptional regulator, light-induced transcriptional regulator